jgi:hypothetical protein
MIYILRTLWVLFYIPVLLLECITFLLGVIIYPLVVGIAYIKTGKESDYSSGVIAEKIGKVYGKLKDKIEKLK